jgi:murein L,D-transpeptidase YcbB/YkuD
MKHILFFATILPVLLGWQVSVSRHGTYQKTRPEQLVHPVLVNTFYQLNGLKMVWMLTGEEGSLVRGELFKKLDQSFSLGIAEKNYHRSALSSYVNNIPLDSAVLWEADRLFTDAAIALCKDIFQGYKMKPWVGYDPLSEACEKKDNEWLLKGLLEATKTHSIAHFMASLEPATASYHALKKELEKRTGTDKTADTVNMLRISMNYYRWIHHFHFDRYIVVNLPSARLRYYEDDSLFLDMKIVVGKTATPTPRFATYSDQVILYPYWYVPPSIIFGEYLPKIKNNPGWLDAHNMQVIDGKGKVLDHHQLNWASFSKGHFPYSIRQSTGCDNALGVIKFNIISPYGVYLHDTNAKTAFLSGLRYYSHGCIRLEEPLELGNRLLNGQLDTAFLQSCFKEQKPVYRRFDRPVPVFSVYMPAVFERDEKIRYYKDVYKLLK